MRVTQARHEHQDRVVADPDRVPAIAAVQQALHVTGGNSLRNAGVAPARDRRHDDSQRPRRQALQIQESQQRAQLARAALDGADAEPLAFGQQEHDNIGAGQALQFSPAGQALVQERARKLHISHDRSLGQPAVGHEPPAIAFRQHLDRCRRRGVPVDDALVFQVLQQRVQAVSARNAPHSRCPQRVAELRDRRPVQDASCQRAGSTL